MPDKDNFGAVLQPVVGALDCRIGAQRAQNAQAGHMIPVAIQGNLIGRDAGGPHGVGASDEGTMYTLTKADVHGIAQPVPIQDGREIDKAQNGMGIGQHGDPAYTLDTTGAQAIAQPVPYDLFQITAPVNRQNRKPGDPCHTLARDNAAHAAVVNMQGSKSNACVSTDGSSFTLNAMHGHDVHAVAFTPGNLSRAAGPSPNAEVAPTQRCGAGDQRTCVAFSSNMSEPDCQTDGTTPTVKVGTDLYNGAITGDVAATMGTPGSSVNASGPTVMAFKPGQSAEARSLGAQVDVACTLEAGGGGNNKQAVAFAQNQVGEIRTSNVSGTLNTNSNASGRNTPMAAVAFHPTQDPISSTDGSTHCMGTGGSQGHASIAVACPTLTAHNDPSRSPQSSEVKQQVAAVHSASMTVRRLTPRECERLQGFPDDYTLIAWRKKPADDCPDGPRYKALGNSMAVNCMEWIGQRIAEPS